MADEQPDAPDNKGGMEIVASTEDAGSNNNAQATDSPVKSSPEETTRIPSAKVEPEELEKVADTTDEHNMEEQNIGAGATTLPASSPAKEPDPGERNAAVKDDANVAEALDTGPGQAHIPSFLDESQAGEIQEHDFDSMFDSMDANPNNDMTFDDMDFTLTGTENSNNSFGDIPNDLDMSVMGTQGSNNDLGALLDYPQEADDFMIVNMPAGNELGRSSNVDDLFNMPDDDNNNNIDLTVESSFEDLFGVGYDSVDGNNGGVGSNTHDGEFDNKFFGLPDE